jgi:aldose 1-epimerase
MSFTTRRYKEKDLSLVGLQDTATGTKIAVLPAYGGLLHAFEIPLHEGPFNVIENYACIEDLDKHLGLSFKSSKLSPFVCRIANGKYIMDDEEFEFTHKFLDGCAIHGLVYNKPFNIVNEFADDNQAAVSLRYHYKKDDKGYPFEYVVEIRYTLHPGRTLQIDTTILNLEELPIPIADGWHPYFQLGGVIDDYEMQFRSGTMLEFDDRLIPTGKLVQNTTWTQPNTIGAIKLDNCFVLQVEEGIPCCVLYNPHNHLSVSLFTNEYYPYLQVYTPDHRKSIAIENLSAAPDCFNNGIGVMLLPPRHSHTFTAWYQVNTQQL